MKMKKKEDNWFDLIAKTMIPNFELLHTDIYQPQTSACIGAYFFYKKLVKIFEKWLYFLHTRPLPFARYLKHQC